MGQLPSGTEEVEVLWVGWVSAFELIPCRIMRFMAASCTSSWLHHALHNHIMRSIVAASCA
jgi:hypothetical protein